MSGGYIDEALANFGCRKNKKPSKALLKKAERRAVAIRSAIERFRERAILEIYRARQSVVSQRYLDGVNDAVKAVKMTELA